VREKIAERIRHRIGAEINAQGQHQLNQAGARFTQLQNCTPQQIGKHYSHKVKILAQLYDEPSRKLPSILVNNSIGKECGCQEQKDRGSADIAAHAHLSKCLLIELDDGPEEQDREQAFRVVVIVEVLLGREAVFLHIKILATGNQSGRDHVEI